MVLADSLPLSDIVVARDGSVGYARRRSGEAELLIWREGRVTSVPGSIRSNDVIQVIGFDGQRFVLNLGREIVSADSRGKVSLYQGKRRIAKPTVNSNGTLIAWAEDRCVVLARSDTSSGKPRRVKVGGTCDRCTWVGNETVAVTTVLVEADPTAAPGDEASYEAGVSLALFDVDGVKLRDLRSTSRIPGHLVGNPNGGQVALASSVVFGRTPVEAAVLGRDDLGGEAHGKQSRGIWTISAKDGSYACVANETPQGSMAFVGEGLIYTSNVQHQGGSTLALARGDAVDSGITDEPVRVFAVSADGRSILFVKNESDLWLVKKVSIVSLLSAKSA